MGWETAILALTGMLSNKEAIDQGTTVPIRYKGQWCDR